MQSAIDVLRSVSIIRSLSGLVVAGWLLSGFAGGAAIFTEASSIADSDPTTVSNIAPSGFLLAGTRGDTIQMAPREGWSPEDLGDAGPVTFSAERYIAPVAASWRERILAGLDAPLVVRARSLGVTSGAAQTDSFYLAGFLPKLALALVCGWFAGRVARWLRPGGEPAGGLLPPGFFKGRHKQP